MTAEPALAEHRSAAAIVDSVRRDPCSLAADDALRALLRLAPNDSDAATVALDAMLPTVSRCIGRTAHPMFYEEVLTELSIVLLEVDDAPPTDQVAKRLAKRAVRRALRRVELENRHRDRRADLDDRFDTPAHVIGVEDLAVLRTEVADVAQRVNDGIDAGVLTHRSWTAFLDGKVLPTVTGHRLPVDRRATYSAVQVVRRHLSHAC